MASALDGLEHEVAERQTDSTDGGNEVDVVNGERAAVQVQQRVTVDGAADQGAPGRGDGRVDRGPARGQRLGSHV